MKKINQFSGIRPCNSPWFHMIFIYWNQVELPKLQIEGVSLHPQRFSILMVCSKVTDSCLDFNMTKDTSCHQPFLVQPNCNPTRCRFSCISFFFRCFFYFFGRQVVLGKPVAPGFLAVSLSECLWLKHIEVVVSRNIRSGKIRQKPESIRLITTKRGLCFA